MWAVDRPLPRGSFRFAGRRYRYLRHPHNDASNNERTVEVPIAARFLDRHRGGRVLELGNVLGYYERPWHEVLDKYERAPWVLNGDVGEFVPDGRYDAVVSVSTLEHVGFDEDVRDADKPVRALERMVSWLNPGGRCLVTVPLGYNASFDERLWSGVLRFDELRFMRRMSRANRWREAAAEDVRDVRYGEPFSCANAIAVGVRFA